MSDYPNTADDWKGRLHRYAYEQSTEVEGVILNDALKWGDEQGIKRQLVRRFLGSAVWFKRDIRNGLLYIPIGKWHDAYGAHGVKTGRRHSKKSGESITYGLTSILQIHGMMTAAELARWYRGHGGKRLRSRQVGAFTKRTTHIVARYNPLSGVNEYCFHP